MYSKGGMKKSGSNLIFGAALLIFALVELSQQKISLGVVFLVIGIYYLFVGMRIRKDEAGNRSTARKESELQRQALAPDAKTPEKMCEPLRTRAPESAWDGTSSSCEEPEKTVQYGYKENEERLDELKGLLDSGIISEEEYQERLRRIPRGK